MQIKEPIVLLTRHCATTQCSPSLMQVSHHNISPGCVSEYKNVKAVYKSMKNANTFDELNRKILQIVIVGCRDTRFKLSAAVRLIPFWDMTLRHGVIGSRRFAERNVFVLKGE